MCIGRPFTTTPPPPPLPLVGRNTSTSIKTRCRPPTDNLLTPTSQVSPLKLSPTSWSIGWCHGWVMPLYTRYPTHTYILINTLSLKLTIFLSLSRGDTVHYVGFCPVQSYIKIIFENCVLQPIILASYYCNTQVNIMKTTKLCLNAYVRRFVGQHTATVLSVNISIISCIIFMWHVSIWSIRI